MKNSRRDFLKKGALAGFSALMIPEIAKAAVKENTSVHAPKINLKKDCVILFQGDSITDCGRDRNSNRCNTMEQFGSGYVLFTATQLLEGKAALQPKIYNRGISGNKVYQLRERWEIDCLAFQPDVLSILIGVNDYWHTLTHGYKGTVETYENDLRALLKYTKEKLPNTQIVLCEPFTLRDGAAIEDSKWYSQAYPINHCFWIRASSFPCAAPAPSDNCLTVGIFTVLMVFSERILPEGTAILKKNPSRKLLQEPLPCT